VQQLPNKLLHGVMIRQLPVCASVRESDGRREDQFRVMLRYLHYQQQRDLRDMDADVGSYQPIVSIDKHLPHSNNTFLASHLG
jgi:hypothetical protein